MISFGALLANDILTQRGSFGLHSFFAVCHVDPPFRFWTLFDSSWCLRTGVINVKIQNTVITFCFDEFFPQFQKKSNERLFSFCIRSNQMKNSFMYVHILESALDFTSIHPDACHTDDLWVLPWCHFVHCSCKYDTKNPNGTRKILIPDAPRWSVIPNPPLFGRDTLIRINCTWYRTNSWGIESNPWFGLNPTLTHLYHDHVSSDFWPRANPAQKYHRKVGKQMRNPHAFFSRGRPFPWGCQLACSSRHSAFLSWFPRAKPRASGQQVNEIGFCNTKLE